MSSILVKLKIRSYYQVISGLLETYCIKIFALHEPHWTLRFREGRRSEQFKKKELRKSIILGFTLIELMIALCVLAILITVAIPSFRTFILNNRLATSADSLVNALNYARAIALNNNEDVVVCPFSAPNSLTCGADWSSGWIVATQPPFGTGILLKSEQNNAVGPTISANGTSITFDERGLANSQTNFTFCDTRGGTFAHSVEVMTTGFIQSGAVRGQAVWNNAALACP